MAAILRNLSQVIAEHDEPITVIDCHSEKDQYGSEHSEKLLEEVLAWIKSNAPAISYEILFPDSVLSGTALLVCVNLPDSALVAFKSYWNEKPDKPCILKMFRLRVSAEGEQYSVWHWCATYKLQSLHNDEIDL